MADTTTNPSQLSNPGPLEVVDSVNYLLSKTDEIGTQVTTNTTNIATNKTNIATNTANIATNTSNIATNTANIALKQDKLDSTQLLAVNSGITKDLVSQIGSGGGGVTITYGTEADLLNKGDSGSYYSHRYYGTIPMPDGFTREQCRYAVWPTNTRFYGSQTSTLNIHISVDQSTGRVTYNDSYMEGGGSDGADSASGAGVMSLQWVCFATKKAAGSTSDSDGVNIVCSKTTLQDGVSSLAANTLYLVYE